MSRTSATTWASVCQLGSNLQPADAAQLVVELLDRPPVVVKAGATIPALCRCLSSRIVPPGTSSAPTTVG